MTWQGRGRLSARIGRPVRLGNYVVPAAVTWTVTGESGTPNLRMHFEIRDGRPECTEFHVTSHSDGRALRTSDVAGLNIDALTRDVFMEFAGISTGEQPFKAEWRTLDKRESWALVKDIEDAQAIPRGPSDAELREVAETYLQNPEAPMKWVEKVHGYSRRTAYRRVAQARERGFLDPPADDSARKGPSQEQVRAALRQRGHMAED